jgi:hypothetical protein
MYDYRKMLYTYPPGAGRAVGLDGGTESGRYERAGGTARGWISLRGDTVRPAGPCDPPRLPVRLTERRGRHTNLPGQIGAYRRFDFHDRYSAEEGEPGYTVLRNGKPCRGRLSLLGALNEYGYMLSDGHAYRVVSA